MRGKKFSGKYRIFSNGVPLWGVGWRPTIWQFLTENERNWIENDRISYVKCILCTNSELIESDIKHSYPKKHLAYVT